jgi:lipoprotein-anchoring transpeptidase ErfK/SrfK
MHEMVELTRRERRIRKRNRITALVSVASVVLIAIAAIVVSRSSDDTRPVGALASSTASASAGSTTTAVTTPQPGTAYIATVKVPQIAVFDSPSAPTPAKTMSSPWFINSDPKLPVPLVFAVKEQQDDGWIEVLLPTRPNGSTGWVRATDVDLATTRYHITVALGAHHLQVFDGDHVVLEDTVAVGAATTPTPRGDYYIVALLKAPNPNTVYGPFAYGLSGHSEVLDTFAGGDAEFGIHGNNDASALGKDVSHGCIRMSNDGITKLASILPLGTPVTITA